LIERTIASQIRKKNITGPHGGVKSCGGRASTAMACKSWAPMAALDGRDDDGNRRRPGPKWEIQRESGLGQSTHCEAIVERCMI